MEDYNLIKYIKNSDTLDYLMNPNLEDRIDQLLELGLENYLLEDINLLNERNWKRLWVLKYMNIEWQSLEEVKEILESESFFISEEELDNYIPNITAYYQKDWEKQPIAEEKIEIDIYEETQNTYKIAGILFSKKRVLRNYPINTNVTKEEALFQALIQDRYLSKEEIENLQKELKGKIARK